MSSHASWRGRPVTTMQLLGILCLVLALATAGSAWYSYHLNAQQRACFQQNLSARSAASQQDFAAMDQLVQHILDTKPGPQASLELGAALQQYLQTRRHNDRVRAEHPFDACGAPTTPKPSKSPSRS